MTSSIAATLTSSKTALISAFLAVFMVVSAARAQDVGEDATRARAFFDAGVAQSRAEAWVDALASFRESLRYLDRPATHVNVAAALLRLGRFIEARAEMDALLRSELNADQRGQAEEMRTRAAASIRQLEIQIEPATAQLVIDGTARSETGAVRRLELDPGEHQLEARAEGYTTVTRAITTDAPALLITLRQLAARLRVRCSIEDAVVTVDGLEVGRGGAEIDLAAGRHELIVSALGHTPFHRWMTFSAGQQLDVIATLGQPTQSVPLEQDPWFWAIGGGSLLVIAGVAIGVGFALTPTGYDGGTLGDVLVAR